MISNSMIFYVFPFLLFYYILLWGCTEYSYSCVDTVVARFRPQNKIELANGGEPIVEFDSEDTCKINVNLKAFFSPSPLFRFSSDAC